ncbi:hypothetical protein [Flexithrix dorotheae]|uniref:hypothetical protein n=1 Tax=Flexithrix dorotheae TaxID=70993 RepID=UPI000364F893|nr:hypothetical protein [Flexithrix dorotheae]
MQFLFFIFIIPFSFVVAIFNLLGFRIKYYLVADSLIPKTIQYWLVVFHVIFSAVTAMLFVNNMLPLNIFFGGLFQEEPLAIPFTILGTFLIICFFLAVIIENSLKLVIRGYRKAEII